MYMYIMVNDRHNITVKATVYLDDYERLTISLVPHQQYHTAIVAYTTQCIIDLGHIYIVILTTVHALYYCILGCAA